MSKHRVATPGHVERDLTVVRDAVDRLDEAHGLDGLELRTRPATAPRRPAGSTPSVMRNAIMSYDWGSRHRLAALQGRTAPGHPEAELWMGAHPRASSSLLDADGGELDLGAAIAADPLGILGTATVAAFGARLPFLLKVLAIERVLSVQVHPGRADAEAGFADEHRRGVPEHGRSFVDAYGKPEQFVALSPVSALAGFRPAGWAHAALGLLGLPALDGVRARLAAGHLPDALADLAALGADDRLVAAARAAAAALLADRAAHPDPALRDALAWVVRIADQHPADPLVVAPLLLAVHHLGPGASMFVPPGTPHAYLEGLAVEVQGASDNVVRGGLTPKRVDVPVLRRLTRDTAVTLHDPRPGGHEGWSGWPVEVPEFRLLTAVLDGRSLAGAPDRPQILLCVEGEVLVTCDTHHVVLGPGMSAFVGASARGVRLVGRGRVFAAMPGLTPD